MLKLILGRAGAGKTALVMNEIKESATKRGTRSILIVPEQYSHEAERELAQTVGDSLPLYGEVLSFTRLASRVAAETGHGTDKYLDDAGRLLVMTLAARAVSPSLRVYTGAGERPRTLLTLLDAVSELKAAVVGADALMRASGETCGVLSDKLHDLALILEAYNAITARGKLDPADRIARLAESAGESALLRDSHIYIDGFTDFTGAELAVVGELIKEDVPLTVCLTCDDLNGSMEIFDASRRTARHLLRTAKANARGYDVTYKEPEGGNEALRFMERHLFTYTSERFGGGGSDTLELYKADSVMDECEFAASKVHELVRGGARYRDIAIAARGFEDYSAALECVFESRSIPLYTARRADVMSKPVPELIRRAYDIITGGWEYADVFGYLKTGLAGLRLDECDALENYALVWDIRGSAWTREAPWRQHPQGFGAEYTGDTERELARLDALRRRVASPLAKLHKATAGKTTPAVRHAEALYVFLEDIGLPDRLESKSRELSDKGLDTTAAEYIQLWDVVIDAMEQCAGILGDTPMERDEFARLFLLVLSRYGIGTIPVSLDRVPAGDMDRMRRRNVRHLIVLGASDSRLPRISESAGVFSDSDRERLTELGIEAGSGGTDELYREMGLIYNCLTLPSGKLIMSYSGQGGDGDERPSFVMTRIKELFELEINGVPPVQSLRTAAGKDFDERLSRESVLALYGETPRISASRADAFAACRFAYFMRYGLRAKPRQQAVFDAPELGTFMHYVLEGVAGEVAATGGFKTVSKADVEKLADKYVEKYAREELRSFAEKNGRFVYLFRRLERTVRAVVADTADELSRSDFIPLDFELKLDGISAAEPGGGLLLTGIADRVDGWERDGKLYLRVVDYKTGKRSFSLSDVWYGMGLQMLVYLFALAESGGGRYGMEIVPAGVLYSPARGEILLSAPRNLTDEEIAKERASKLRRSGLILDDPGVIAAMESGGEPKYIPVTFKKDEATGDALTSAERLEALAGFTFDTLKGLGGELRRGSVDATPYYRSANDTACTYCEYGGVCGFAGERHRYLSKLKTEEFWAALEAERRDGNV